MAAMHGLSPTASRPLSFLKKLRLHRATPRVHCSHESGRADGSECSASASADLRSPSRTGWRARSRRADGLLSPSLFHLHPRWRLELAGAPAAHAFRARQLRRRSVLCALRLSDYLVVNRGACAARVLSRLLLEARAADPSALRALPARRPVLGARLAGLRDPL